MKKIISTLAVFLLVGILLTGCGGNQEASNKDGQITLEFFQYKQEAVGAFDHLIAEFEKENPNIKIEQNNVPEPDTVLRSRLSKNDIPAIMTINGAAVYGELADSGIYANFTDDPILDDVQEAYIRMVRELHGDTDTSYGIPYTANAVPIIYNKDKFEELGLEVPTTWNQLIATAEKIKEAGETPFYLTFREAWTTLPSWNALASNLAGIDFIKAKAEGETTFKEGYHEVAKRMYSLLEYGDDDNFATGYNQGNIAFANGKSVMYLQGIWALGQIKQANPDINLGVFAFPAVNDSSQNKLVSGVDTVLTMSIKLKGEEAKAAKKFIHFLLEKKNAEYYIGQQKLFSTLKGVYQQDPILASLQEYFKTGRLVPFSDHYYPSGLQIENLIQEFLLDGNVDAFLEKLDNEWDKVQARQ